MKVSFEIIKDFFAKAFSEVITIITNFFFTKAFFKVIIIIITSAIDFNITKSLF